MEDEINKILESITPSEYKSLTEIKEIRESKIDSIYSRFLRYEKNKDNCIESKNQLENFEFIDDITNLKKNDMISTINTFNFVDLRAASTGRIIDINYESRGKITIIQGMFFKTFKNSTNIFRLIPEDRLVKLKLLEIIDEE